MKIVDPDFAQPRREAVLRQARLPRQRRKPHIHKHFHVCGVQSLDDVVDGAVLVTDRRDRYIS
jgi:hypothetical protein